MFVMLGRMIPILIFIGAVAVIVMGLVQNRDVACVAGAIMLVAFAKLMR